MVSFADIVASTQRLPPCRGPCGCHLIKRSKKTGAPAEIPLLSRSVRILPSRRSSPRPTKSAVAIMQQSVQVPHHGGLLDVVKADAVGSAAHRLVLQPPLALGVPVPCGNVRRPVEVHLGRPEVEPVPPHGVARVGQGDPEPVQALGQLKILCAGDLRRVTEGVVDDLEKSTQGGPGEDIAGPTGDVPSLEPKPVLPRVLHLISLGGPIPFPLPHEVLFPPRIGFVLVRQGCQIRPKIVGKDEQIIPAQEEPIELVQVMLTGVLPYASNLLPHVVV
mmetsp:Transcript_36542/g.77905  ORF Transcript_36542/g.77905 Transcript_36542/m.77905 type:complete len:276 (+) Transcript_36542:462-1289(+)